MIPTSAEAALALVAAISGGWRPATAAECDVLLI